MVIQRLQNLYLLISSILFAVLAFVPCASVITGEHTINIGSMWSENLLECSQLSYVISILLGLAFFMPLLTISKFHNLKFQKNLCGISIMITLALILLVLICTFNIASYFNGSIAINSSISLPLVALILEIMALRGIKADRKLLSDSSRLR